MMHPKKGEIRKPTKTLAGVTPIAVMCKPKKCSHGTCLYCPSLNVPQSYTPKSPPVLRAERLKYSALEQVKSRLKAFEVMHHPTDKIELIVMGGNFPEYDKKYKINFIGLMAKTEIELNTAIENEHFKVVSSYFNLYNTWPAKYFDKLKSKKLDFIAIQPLKYGILTDGFASTKKPFDKYASLIYYSSENAFKNIFAWQKNNYSEPLQTTALKFALAHESVKTVIIGISSANHLIENLNIEPLNKLDFYNIINTELK